MILFLYRSESVEKPSPVDKSYEPVSQVTPSLPPATLPKPSTEGKIKFLTVKISSVIQDSHENASVYCIMLCAERHSLLLPYT